MYIFFFKLMHHSFIYNQRKKYALLCRFNYNDDIFYGSTIRDAEKSRSKRCGLLCEFDREDMTVLRAHEVFRQTDGVFESRDIPVPFYSRIARGTSSWRGHNGDRCKVIQKRAR